MGEWFEIYFKSINLRQGQCGMKRKGTADCQNIESRRKLLGDRWSNLTSCLDSVILVLGVTVVIADTGFTFLLLLLTQKGVAKNGFCKTSLQYYPKLTSPEPSQFKMVHSGSSLDSEPSWEGRQVFSLFLCFSLWGIQLMFSAIKKEMVGLLSLTALSDLSTFHLWISLVTSELYSVL